MKLHILFLCFLFGAVIKISGQQPGCTINMHSHNDYLQARPFWMAYNNRAASIEADIILHNDTLYVAHEKETIKATDVFEIMYLQPLISALKNENDKRSLAILIDIKNDARKTLDRIVAALDIFVKENKNLLGKHDVKFVISGSRPSPQEYINYPDFIMFDHQNAEDIAQVPMHKVFMMSFSIAGYVKQENGKRLPDLKKIKALIDIVHEYNKPVRFWGTPDTEEVWLQLSRLGVDYIGTDDPERFRKWCHEKPEKIKI